MSVRIECYNVTNTAFPNTDFTSATFGPITAGATTYGPRTLRAAVRYVF